MPLSNGRRDKCWGISAMNKNIISIQDLKRAFGTKEVLKGVNLSIPRNSIYALLGHNGAGKTTLIRIILGLLNADSGNIQLYYDTQKPKNYHDIGVVFDEPSLFDELSAIDNLNFFAELNSINKKERNILIKQELEKAKLWDRRKDKVKNWSTGMRQRLAIIRSSLVDHEILILDEPSAGLDPEVLTWLYEKMLEFKNRGGTILFTTHNFEDVECVSDYAAILQDGIVLGSGKTSELLHGTDSKIFEIAIGQPNKAPQIVSLLENVLNQGTEVSVNDGKIEISWKNEKPEIYQVLDTIRNSGVEVLEFKEKKHSLREVYLSYTRGEV